MAESRTFESHQGNYVRAERDAVAQKDTGDLHPGEIGQAARIEPNAPAGVAHFSQGVPDFEAAGRLRRGVLQLPQQCLRFFWRCVVGLGFRDFILPQFHPLARIAEFGQAVADLQPSPRGRLRIVELRK